MRIRRSRRDRELVDWIAEFRASASGQDALMHLRELDNGNLDEYRWLEKQVLEECFYAQRLARSPEADYIEESLDEARSFRESIPDLIAAIQRIKRAADARPHLFSTYTQPASLLLRMQKREGEVLPNRISRSISEFMTALEDGLSRAKEDKGLTGGRTAGCLKYSKDIRNQRSANHAENGLIFSLALHFRHWTGSGLGKNIKSYTMPQEGRPYFPIIAKFVYATLGSEGSEPYKPRAIEDRLKKLLKNHPGVRYVGWGK